MKKDLMITIGINAGIACLDRANEVEPRPNEDKLIMNYELKMSERRAKMKAEKSRRDNTLLTVCFSLRYGVALKKSRRDDISVAEENSTFSIKKSRRDDMSGLIMNYNTIQYNTIQYNTIQN